jgi:hypothetical protein
MQIWLSKLGRLYGFIFCECNDKVNHNYPSGQRLYPFFESGVKQEKAGWIKKKYKIFG